MNPDYNPKQDFWGEGKKPYRGRYIEPFWHNQEEHDAKIRLERNSRQVARVITQGGLVGALVLSYITEGLGSFKILTKDGMIVEGMWDFDFKDDKDPSGISSNGWTVMSLGVEPSRYILEDIPF
jgi:hypothetical protein